MSTSTPLTPEADMRSLSLNPSESVEHNMKVIPFYVDLPETIIEGDHSASPSSGSKSGVVGTVTFLNKSAMVWIGWGRVEEGGENEEKGEKIGNHVSGSGIPTMGSMVASMPRVNYSGAGTKGEAPCSQLIGSSNEEEMLLGWQIASRLSEKVGWPVFVSCSLGTNVAGTEGLEGPTLGGSLAQLAAGFAEKEVRKILMKRKNYLIENNKVL